MGTITKASYTYSFYMLLLQIIIELHLPWILFNFVQEYFAWVLRESLPFGMQSISLRDPVDISTEKEGSCI